MNKNNIEILNKKEQRFRVRWSTLWKEQCKKCKSAIPISFYAYVFPLQMQRVCMPKCHGTQFCIAVYFYVHACLGTILQPTTPSATRTKWLYGQCPLKLWWWEKSVLLVAESCTWLALDLRIFMLHDRVVGYWGNQKPCIQKIGASNPIEVKKLCSLLEVLLFLCETATDLKLWPKELMVFNSSKLKPSTSCGRRGSRGGRTPW